MIKEKFDTAMPSVHDLRRMPCATVADDAFLGHALEVGDGDAWDFWRASGQDVSGRHESGMRHLVVMVLEGALVIGAEGAQTRLNAGESAIVTPGLGFDWQVDGKTRWIVNRHRDGGPQLASVPAIHPVDPDARQAASASPAAELLVGPSPDCTKLELASSGDGSWSAGLWTATPYERVPVRYGYSEMMQLHAGSLTIFDDQGREVTFRAGDILVVAEGARAGWRSTEDVRKLWSIFSPATP